MLICFSLLRFHKFGVGNRGGREGPNVAKMVNTDNPHPRGTVCRSVSGPLFNRIISPKKTAGLLTIAHFSQFLRKVSIRALPRSDFDQLPLKHPLSRQRPRVRVPSSPPFFSSSYKLEFWNPGAIRVRLKASHSSQSEMRGTHIFSPNRKTFRGRSGRPLVLPLPVSRSGRSNANRTLSEWRNSIKLLFGPLGQNQSRP
jgi:hypothetical protein